MKPTYDELLEIIHQLREENKQLREKIRELEERLNQNSENSSQPSSKDQKKNKQAPKGGAKLGHKGHFRALLPEEQITKKIVSCLKSCPHCGSDKIKTKDSVLFQQIDLPPIQPEVTQIEREHICCLNCSRRSIAPLPEGYDETAFGPRLTAFVGMCSSVYRLGKRAIQDLLKTAFGIECGLGSVPSMERRISLGLARPYEDLFRQVDSAKVGYVDETPFRQACKTHYVWTVCTQQASFLRILPSRGLDSLNQVRPRGHPGITITDRYQAYAYDKHQYCLAHIRRDLEKFAQRSGVDGEIAQRALFELQEIFSACRLSCRKTMQTSVGYRKRKFKDILYDAFANASDSFSRFADRLLEHFQKFFLFTRYEGVESTNNAAERALRHIVLWRKTSYGTQSELGSQFMERSVSIFQTLKKQGRDIFDFFIQAYKSTFDPNVPIPAI